MKGRLLTSLLTMLTLSGIQAQNIPATPRLVVGLTIDQLRTDYIEAFAALYGEKGFKRLKREAKIYGNAEYDFVSPERASAVASLHTGSVPTLHGIIAGKWLDINSLQLINCTDDSNYIGNYTSETASATRLLTSTLGDELKIAKGPNALVYAVSPFRDAAILSAGHAANGAFWLNEATGKWCGTTYYADFPAWLSRYNDTNGIDFRISDMTWTPLLPIEAYTYAPQTNSTNPSFRHKFDDGGRNRYRRLIQSPLINDEVNTVVEQMLQYSGLGVDRTTDLLNITYYAGNLPNEVSQHSELELQDIYLRLDRSIARLLELLDEKIGLKNVLLVITSTGAVPDELPDPVAYRVPTGEFHINRCAALLNMFLIAKYGEGNYVETYYDRQIFLNERLIEQKQLSLSDIQDKSAEFLIQFAGVREVYSANRILLGAWTPQIQQTRNAYHRQRSGDLLIEVLPGWKVIDDKQNTNKVVRLGQPLFPIYFAGFGIRPETVHTPISVSCIAPTLAFYMRIRAPNAAQGQTLTDLQK